MNLVYKMLYNILRSHAGENKVAADHRVLARLYARTRVRVLLRPDCQHSSQHAAKRGVKKTNKKFDIPIYALHSVVCGCRVELRNATTQTASSISGQIFIV